MLLSQWALLGFVAWTVLLVVATIGAPRLTAIARKEARPNSYNAAVPHGSERYQRSMRAHANCVENLPVFAALVLLGGSLGVTGTWFQVAAFCVLPARVLQSLAHIGSGRNRAILARFAFFSVQLVCFFIMGAALLRCGLR
ncbi:MAG: MAPEG family protein [Myxococcales bacterium]|nr:MAG: MAPEG family protein [Myxococcales bacterium]